MIVEQMRHELEDMQANKLHLQGHLEKEPDRLSTSTLLDDVQQRGFIAQKRLDKSRKKYSQLEVVLVEAKDVMLRIEKAAQSLASCPIPRLRRIFELHTSKYKGKDHPYVYVKDETHT